ncbi:hypothetical protein HDK90DRAFT_263829 [Phyllosticta capitalensis]|uniref:Malate dehydrogenase n=1 Tax=Phyllosticta capitalensis TaxID=121624 RepID=A0ABR1YLG8_9PEZI
MHFSPVIVFFAALAPSCILAAPTKTTDFQRRTNARRAPSSSSSSVSDDTFDISALSQIWQQASSCDISSVTMPLSDASSPTSLPSPSSGLVLSHVAVGRGTQNYTCSGLAATETPKAVGAVATLFNATCAAANSPSLLYDTPAIALQYDIPTAASALEAYSILLSGHHYFTNTTTPFFNLDTADHTWGVMAGKKEASVKAPSTGAGAAAVKKLADDGVDGTENGSCAWLQLAALDEPGLAWKEVYRLNTAGGNAPDTCEGIDGDFEVQYAATYWFWS